MGSLLALIAAVLNSAKDTTSKLLASNVDPTISTFASFAFALPFYLVLLAVLLLSGHEVVTLSGVFLSYVALRAVTDTATESCKMHALAHGELSIVSSLIALNPVIILLLGPFITGDEIRTASIVGITIAVAGNFVFLYSVDRKTTRRALVLGAACACFMALNTCFDRMSVQHGTPVFSGFMMTLLSALILFRVIPGRQTQSQLREYARPFALRGALETAFMIT
ncbi:MAG: EamA family transporter, partial [Deltaproteobacteria bacterium]|nr:EamA family transporter [Deltaproteobacteria bacterium]